MLDFDAINDSLIVGSAFRADHVPLLVELKILAVVNLQSEAADPVDVLDMHGIIASRIGCQDLCAPSLGQLEEAVETIARHIDDGRRVYLHCFAGLQRAVTVAACYLIWSDPDRYNARTALEEVTLKRRNACPTRAQIDAILDFDRYVRGLPSRNG